MSKRTYLVLLFAVLVLAPGASFSAAPLDSPYPDVWEWAALPELAGERVELSPDMLSDGDVLISAIYKRVDGTFRFDRRTFFSRKAVDEKLSDWDKNILVLNDGTKVERVEPQGLPGSAEVATHPIKGLHTLSDGSRVMAVSVFYRQCYRGPANSSLAIKSPNNSQFTRRRVFLVLLEKPVRFVGGGGDSWFGEPNASCPNEGPLDLNIRVQAMGGTLVSLRDDTFLLVDQQHGLVLRLDRNLESRSRLMNTQVFGFPYKDSFLVDDLTGKSYGRPEDETARISQATYQAALDDLYDHLLRIRNGN